MLAIFSQTKMFRKVIRITIGGMTTDQLSRLRKTGLGSQVDRFILLIMNEEDYLSYKSVCKNRQVLFLLLEACWDLFYPYLLNDDIGKIDLALTEKGLRGLYFNQVGKFYLFNNISSVDELEWLMKRGISLTKCGLEIDSEG